MTMVPEAWEKDQRMNIDKKAYYNWSSMAMEPWDGPGWIDFLLSILKNYRRFIIMLISYYIRLLEILYSKNSQLISNTGLYYS